MKIKDQLDEVPTITFYEVSLSNGETLRARGEAENSWEQIKEYIDDNKLAVAGIRLVVRSRFYHLPTKSGDYRYRSEIPKSLRFVYNEDKIGIKAIFNNAVVALWVDKKQGHCWVQIRKE